LGQGLDIVWHSKTSYEGKEPTVANYLKMCANKTGALARLSAKLSATVCGATNEQIEAIGNFAESIGIAFQIQDDMLNIETNGFLSNSKGGIGEDIHEGKRTIMVIHCFDNAPQHDVRRLKEILAMKTNDQKLIVEAIEIIQSNGGKEFAQKTAQELVENAWKLLDPLLPDTDAKLKLKYLADFTILRNN